ncbi:MAG TPA: protein kinase [Kofleriaceae bacterium]|nr:protein kinase [Kofleriaceae bacterium]
MDLEVGQIIAGRYEVRARTLEAPAYVDWRAHDREIEVDVSLWWIAPELLAAAGTREALEAGVNAARRLGHPAVRKMFGGGRDGDGFWVASQLGTVAASGVDLVRVANALAEGLEALHAAGLVHGRLCPTDVVDVAGALKVSGGGLWQSVDADVAARVWKDASRFLAPEVLDGAAATPRSDVYSMAAVLLELAAGVTGQNLVDTMDVLAADRPRLADILQRGLADVPDRRYDRPSGLVERLREVASMPAVSRDDADLDDSEESLSGLDGEATIEESSPLFKDASAMPRSVLFGPNQPTVLGKARPEHRPPPAADVKDVKKEKPAGSVPKADPGAETVIAPPEARVGKVLEVVSHMPAKDPEVAPATPVVSVIDRPEMQPVLRPIGSSERAKRLSAPPGGSLGTYAPPREKREVETKTEPVSAPKKAMWPWIVIAVSLLVVAAVVSLVLLNRKESKPPPQPAPAPSPAASPPPEPVVKPLAPTESSQ